MSADGYVVVRRSTLAWLLECYRSLPEDLRPQITNTVVEDLRAEILSQVEAPRPTEERLRGSGPLLSEDDHLEIVMRELDAPKSQREFAAFIVRTVHTMLRSEAETVLRIIGEQS